MTTDSIAKRWVGIDVRNEFVPARDDVLALLGEITDLRTRLDAAERKLGEYTRIYDDLVFEHAAQRDLAERRGQALEELRVLIQARDSGLLANDRLVVNAIFTALAGPPAHAPACPGPNRSGACPRCQASWATQRPLRPRVGDGG